MDIEIIDTGYFYADGGAMFGAIPKTAWSRRYPSNETNGCVLAMRSLLVSNVPEKVILIDNGAGTKHLRQLSYYNFFNLVDLGEELHKRGISPGQVTDVVLTHLHFDHCGYSTLKNEETGEIYRPEDYSRAEWDEIFGVHIPKPWELFRTELDVRMGDDPKGFLDTHSDVALELDYPEYDYENLRPIFVSRMPNHKVTGAAHADTIRSPRHFKDEGIVLTKTALTDLKLDKDGEIDGYYNPQSDLLLYEALKKQLLLYGNDAKKAFAQDFHKPKADGTEGPVVRKVKIQKKQTMGVFVDSGNGIAENGGMVRIDVFHVNGKYYFVPVYTADVVKKVLPNRAATAHKPYGEWKVMEDKDFLFSLYSRDLIHIKSKKDIPIKMVNGGMEGIKETYAYYIGADISAANIQGIAHDSRYKFRGLGIQSLDVLEKCQIDVLGHVSVVRSEKRMGFS